MQSHEYFDQAQLDALLADIPASSVGQNHDWVTGQVLNDDCFVIRINGRAIGVENAGRVMAAIRRLIADIGQHVILNLRLCPFLSSFALGELAVLAGERRKRGRKVLIIEANDVIRGTLKLARLDEVMVVCDTEADALRMVDDEGSLPAAS